MYSLSTRCQYFSEQLFWKLSLSFVTIGFFISAQPSDWCYEGRGNCGPKFWKPKCKFQAPTQSPIDIIPLKTRKSKPNRTLIFSKGYYDDNTFNIVNNGYTVTLTLSSETNLGVKGAGFLGQYNFVNMHFHWGSEHMVKGVAFPLELHIVLEQANGNGGLGILSILYGYSKNDNKGLVPIIESLQNVADSGDILVGVTDNIKLSSLFPAVWDVFRYQDVSSISPCNGSIIWSVFTQRMPISSAQVKAFSVLKDPNGDEITCNNRSVKPTVTKSRRQIIWMPVNKTKMMDMAF